MIKYLLILISFFIMILFNTKNYAHDHNHDAYIGANNVGDDKIPQERTDWMQDILDDTTFITDVAIPGTHDTATYNFSNATSPNLKTQGMNLNQQLRLGIRAFDMRLCIDDRGWLMTCHGNTFTGVAAATIIDTVDDFLNAHPQEFIIIRIKKERDKDSEDEVARLFEQELYKFSYKLLQKNIFIDKVTVRDARGHILILSEMTSTHHLGTNYHDPKNDIEDHYNVTTIWEVDEKSHLVTEHLKSASQGNYSTLYTTFFSANGGAFPYSVASNHTSEGQNAPHNLNAQHTHGTNLDGADFINSLNNNNISSSRTVGLIFADHIGFGLVNAVINNNYKRHISK